MVSEGKSGLVKICCGGIHVVTEHPMYRREIIASAFVEEGGYDGGVLSSIGWAAGVSDRRRVVAQLTRCSNLSKSWRNCPRWR
jgi:hypothetical protein